MSGVYDAIVLAGGAARRLGGADKPALDIGGTTRLARVVDAARGAHRVVIVGPRRRLSGTNPSVVWCQEQPAGGGPVAALATAAPLVAADTVLVLAADLPWVGAAVELLLAAMPVDGVALLADPQARPNHLAAAWRRPALLAALGAVGDPRGAPMHALLRTVPSVLVPDEHGWGTDCDTWHDVDAARRRSVD